MPSYRQSAKIGAAITLFTLAAGAAHAQSISGTIDSSITLVSACSIDGNASSTGVDFGSLEFGTRSALFGEADAQVADGSGISVLCSPGVTATFTLLNGSHDGEVSGEGSIHAMQHETQPAAYIGYTLYTDDARTTELPPTGTIELAEFEGGPITLDLYGRAFGNPGQLPAGYYEDTLQVQLTW